MTGDQGKKILMNGTKKFDSIAFGITHWHIKHQTELIKKRPFNQT